MSAQAAAVDYVHATQFTTDVLGGFAGRVAAVVPMDDARVFPVSGGSEANETAFKLARAYQLARGENERHLVLARDGAYHGNSRGALDASDRAALRAGYEPWLGQTVRVPLVHPYRDRRSGAEHAAEIDRIIRDVGPGRIAAFIAEPVSGRDARRGRSARRLLAGGRRRVPRARGAPDPRRGDDRVRADRAHGSPPNTGACDPTSSRPARVRRAGTGRWDCASRRGRSTMRSRRPVASPTGSRGRITRSVLRSVPP